jgi:hypothetical protein
MLDGMEVRWRDTLVLMPGLDGVCSVSRGTGTGASGGGDGDDGGSGSDGSDDDGSGDGDSFDDSR